MKSQTIIPLTAAFLIVTLPFWALIPGIGYLLEIVTALAVLMAVVDQKVWYVVGAFIVAVILGSLFLGSIKPVPLFLPDIGRAVLAPLLAGVAINQGRRAATAYVVSAVTVGCMALLLYFQIDDLLVDWFATLGQSTENTIVAAMQAEGYGTEAINRLRDNVHLLISLIKHLAPGMLILSAMAQMFIAFVMVEWYYIRRDSYFPGFGSFVYWKAPEYLLYAFGVALMARLVFDGAVQMAADNALLILAVVFCVTGLSFIENLLRKLRLPLFLKIVFYIGLFIMQVPGFVLAAVAGLFDSYFDFRKTKAHTLG